MLAPTTALKTVLLLGWLAATAFAQPARAPTTESDNAKPAAEDLDEPDASDEPIESADDSQNNGRSNTGVFAIALASSGPTSSVENALLIGDGGRVFQYDPSGAAASPRWVRQTAGGTSATFVAATCNKDAVVAMGAKSPVFRWRDGQWIATPLTKGNIVVGSGPVMSLAVGRWVYLWEQGKFVRKAFAPANVTGLWVGTETNIRLSTDRGLFRRGAKLFVPVRTGRMQLTPGVIVGARPTLVSDKQLIDIDSLRVTKLPGTSVMSASSPFGIAVVTGDRDQYKISIATATGLIALPALPAISGGAGAAPRSHRPRALAIASNGDVLLATEAAMLLYRNKAWRTVSLTTALPRGKPGAGPALSQ
jgi:hypothetical protein